MSGSVEPAGTFNGQVIPSQVAGQVLGIDVITLWPDVHRPFRSNEHLASGVAPDHFRWLALILLKEPLQSIHGYSSKCRRVSLCAHSRPQL